MTGGEPTPRRGPFSAGLALSVVLHALVLGALVLVVRPAPRVDQKRGEPLFVELPNLSAPAPKGNPSERSPRAQPTEGAAGAIPPAPAVPPPGPPPVERPAIKEMPGPTPRVASVPRAEAPPVPPMKERVAPVPRPEPRMARPGAPLPSAEREKPDLLGIPGPGPARREPQVAREAQARAAPPEPESPKESNFGRTPAPLPTPTREAPADVGGGAPSATTAAPTQTEPEKPAAAGDRLAALRPHPPGGGLVGGRGGIEGEPIPLDTKDPKFGDYFERLRRAIQEKWLYPREAADKNIGGQLVLEFGIAGDGQLRFIELRRSSGVAVLDDYAINAVKLASPFPPIPSGLGRSGIPVVAVFNYIIEGSLYNFLR
jgi:periplasmic protein TonB